MTIFVQSWRVVKLSVPFWALSCIAGLAAAGIVAPMGAIGPWLTNLGTRR